MDFRKKKTALLQAGLEVPEVPLHTKGNKHEIGEHVIRNKISGVLEAIWGDSVAIPASASRKPAANWIYPFDIICLTAFEGIKPIHFCLYSSASVHIP